MDNDYSALQARSALAGPQARVSRKEKSRKPARKRTRASRTSDQKILVSDSFTNYSTQSTWTDGQSFGPWRVVFAGYGPVSVVSSPTSALRIQPATATGPESTHASLVVSRESYAPPCLRVGARLRTVNQLRQGSPPNPWEVGWLVWDYTDNDHFTYLALKPNGWELGKRDPAYPGGQRFLATGSHPVAEIGAWQEAVVKRRVRTATTSTSVIVNGKSVANFVDSERPYRSGAVGIYSEDSTVELDRIAARSC
ncbi:MAG: hypothetical protein Q8P61_09550 [Candidatus Nanopelagicales bacterium]|nr:hypothetical protein [Candidatus Nanopelagicales bacterium]